MIASEIIKLESDQLWCVFHYNNEHMTKEVRKG